MGRDEARLGRGNAVDRVGPGDVHGAVGELDLRGARAVFGGALAARGRDRPGRRIAAETITVLVSEQLVSSQSWSEIEVGPNDAARVLEIVNDGAGAQPNSSERNVLSVYVWKSMQAVPPDGSRNADTVVSVQTLSTQALEKLSSWFPPPVVSAATGTTDAAISRTRPARTLATRFISWDLHLSGFGRRP